MYCKGSLASGQSEFSTRRGIREHKDNYGPLLPILYHVHPTPHFPTFLPPRFFPIQNVAKGRKRWILSVPVRGQVCRQVSYPCMVVAVPVLGQSQEGGKDGPPQISTAARF